MGQLTMVILTLAIIIAIIQLMELPSNNINNTLNNKLQGSNKTRYQGHTITLKRIVVIAIIMDRE